MRHLLWDWTGIPDSRHGSRVPPLSGRVRIARVGEAKRTGGFGWVMGIMGYGWDMCSDGLWICVRGKYCSGEVLFG